MEEKKQETVVVKISMPLDFAEEFMKDSKYNFGDVRWVNIMFKDRMYKALHNMSFKNDDGLILEKIQIARIEILDAIHKYYEKLMKENGKVFR